ncbi:MAG TPA: sigma-70 family RNA polymerase sigma factor [Rudaea sp.]|jgi:RNA polymerase sigma-70 factor (ECF subfamily)|nr:sigma-70 family RNA polymerase sigma factor [Rudaea sp.]
MLTLAYASRVESDAHDSVFCDTEPDDADLARRIAAARPGLGAAAEAELYRRLAPRVRLYGLKHLREPQAAADLVQQVLLMTIERLRAGHVREPERLASYVLGMCRMVVLDLQRTHARHGRLLVTFAHELRSEQSDGTPHLDDACLLRCLGRLPERERSILVMTFYDDRQARDVAIDLGISEGNVRVIRHRGLERLRECMGMSEAAP